MKSRSGIVVVAVLAVLAVAGGAAATPVGPVLQVPSQNVFQAPLSGISFTESGVGIGRAGGLTWTYSGIDSSLLSQFASLEWGPADSASVELDMNDPSFSNGADVLSFDAADSDLANGTAVWMGGPIGFLSGNVNTRLTITVRDLSNAPIAFQTTSGYGDGATVPLTGNFKANLELDVGSGSSWSPYLDTFDSLEQELNLSGNQMFDSVTAGFFYTAAATPPAVSVQGHDFGSQPLGSHTSHAITVKNTGGQALTVMNVATTGSDFSVSSENCTTGPVASEGTCTVTVEFTPSASGARAGTLVLTDNASDSPQSVNLGGTGVAIPIGPVLQVPNGTTFQSPLGAVSFSRVGSIGRTGGLTWTYGGITPSLLSQFQSLEWGPASASSIELAVDDASFSNPADVLSFDAADSDLAHGKAVWMGGPIPFLTFNPQTRLTILVTDLSNNPIAFHTTTGYADGATVSLTGNFKANLELDVGSGSSWSPYLDTFDSLEPGGQLSGHTAYESVTAGLFYTASASAPAVSMQSYDFQTQRLGTHPTHDVTVTNTGNSSLTVTQVATTGDAAFSVAGETCTTSSPIPPNGTCTVTVEYSPTVDGQVQGSLVLTDNAPNSPQSVHLNGFGIHSAVSFTLPSNSFDFGSQTISTTSGVSTATITNSGTTDLNVGQLTVSGDFALVNDTCSNQDVPNGQTCSFGVTFTPTQLGSRTGAVTVPSDAQSSPDSVPLSGTGIAPQPFLGLPSSVSFGSDGIGHPTSKTVTVTNTGSANLHVTSTSAGGDYSVTSDTCTGSSVAPNATCTIGVTFTPSGRGPSNGTLTIVSDAASSPDHVTLTGTGIDAHFVLSPNPLDFGDVHTGQSKTLTLTFSNPGQDDAHFTGNPSLVGSNPGDFALNFGTFTCGTSPPAIPAGGSCTLTITFTPGGSGTRSASLTFPNDSGDGPQTLILTGDGINPHVSASPSPLVFGPQPLGTPSPSTNVTITNTGSTTLAISGVSSGGEFTADASNCAPGLVAPGQSCVVKVTFTPSGTGTRTGSLQITSNALSSPDSVSLSGTGIDPKLSAPVSTDFGSVQIGHSTAKTIVISSSGSTSLSVQGVAISGNGFSIVTDGCSLQTVAPGGTCSVTVQFAPFAGGHAVGTLTVQSNAPSSPDQLGLSGDGLGGTFSASPASAGFGIVVDGTTAEKTVTISNSGTGPLTFSGFGFVGAGAAAYSIDPNGTTCTATTVLASGGGSCTVVIAFSPAADGVYNASLELNGDGTNSPFDVPLSGSGVSPKLLVNPLGLVFGIQPIIGHLTVNAATQTIIVTSAGTSALTISGIAVTGPFVLVGDGCSQLGPLPSGLTCLVQVAFVPTVVGLAYGTLTFTSDAGTRTMSLSGTGIDTTPPTLHNVPANITVQATGTSGSPVSYTPPTATDAVDPSPSVVCAPPSGGVFPLGTTTVTCTATDASGNSASATFTVTVIADTAPPTLHNVPANRTVEATGHSGAPVSYVPPTATDAVDPSPSVVCSPASGGVFPLGTTTVTCTATDASGNKATATFTVTVRDTTRPTLSGLPGPITVPATGPAGAVVTFSGPTASDLVDGSVPVVCKPSSGSTFAVGTTTVICKATDSHGNVASGTFTVTVLGPVQQIQALQDVVNGLPELQGYHGPAKDLRTKLNADLQNALDELTQRRPDLHGACDAMAAFVRDATDARNIAPRGPLSAADSASLAAAAKRVERAMGC